MRIHKIRQDCLETKCKIESDPSVPFKSSFVECQDMVVPAGFEPAAFHLGGGRSIQLSYGTTWRPVSYRSFRLRIVCDQRPYIVTFELTPSVQEAKLDKEVKAADLAA